MQSNNSGQDDEFKKEKKMLGNYARYSGLGFQMIVIIGLFAWLGYYIDEKRQSATPIFTALLSLLGVCIALYLVIRSVKKLKP